MSEALTTVKQLIYNLKQNHFSNEHESLIHILDSYKNGPRNLREGIFYVYKNEDIISFYIDNTNDTQTSSNVAYHIENAAAYIDVATDIDNHSAVLRFVYVNESDEKSLNSMRGKGVGTFLILYAITYLKLIGIETLTLDDDSDNARQPNNIYMKLGCKYDDDDGGPEMTCDINDMIHNWESYKFRYETVNSMKSKQYGYKSKRNDRHTKKPYQSGGKHKKIKLTKRCGSRKRNTIRKT